MYRSKKAYNKSSEMFIERIDESTPGEMYGLMKTRKAGNPAIVITSGCSAAM